jgi:hypothetical protein
MYISPPLLFSFDWLLSPTTVVNHLVIGKFNIVMDQLHDPLRSGIRKISIHRELFRYRRIQREGKGENRVKFVPSIQVWDDRNQRFFQVPKRVLPDVPIICCSVPITAGIWTTLQWFTLSIGSLCTTSQNMWWTGRL